jgi:DNA polymerase-1
MIRVADYLKAQKLRTRMVLQVHDELIFEVPEDELQIKEKIRELMQDVVQLRVPLTVNLKQGRNWESMTK